MANQSNLIKTIECLIKYNNGKFKSPAQAKFVLDNYLLTFHKNSFYNNEYSVSYDITEEGIQAKYHEGLKSDKRKVWEPVANFVRPLTSDELEDKFKADRGAQIAENMTEYKAEKAKMDEMIANLSNYSQDEFVAQVTLVTKLRTWYHIKEEV